MAWSINSAGRTSSWAINILHFDYEVLMGYTVLDLPSQLATLDLLLDVDKIARPQAQARIHRPGNARHGKDGRGPWTPSSGGGRGGCWKSPNTAVTT